MVTLTYKAKVVLEYFYKKNLWKQPFLRYAFFSKKIKFLFDGEISTYERRKIFDSLVANNYFIIQDYHVKKSRKVLYQLRTSIISNLKEPYTIIFN